MIKQAAMPPPTRQRKVMDLLLRKLKVDLLANHACHCMEMAVVWWWGWRMTCCCAEELQTMPGC